MEGQPQHQRLKINQIRRRNKLPATSRKMSFLLKALLIIYLCVIFEDIFLSPRTNLKGTCYDNMGSKRAKK